MKSIDLPGSVSLCKLTQCIFIRPIFWRSRMTVCCAPPTGAVQQAVISSKHSTAAFPPTFPGTSVLGILFYTGKKKTKVFCRTSSSLHSGVNSVLFAPSCEGNKQACSGTLARMLHGIAERCKCCGKSEKPSSLAALLFLFIERLRLGEGVGISTDYIYYMFLKWLRFLRYKR